MSQKRQSLGRWGEELAAAYLTQRGYVVLERNVQTPYGEIDLVTLDQQGMVFVEVTTRSSNTYGWPEEAVTPRKQEHLLSAAQAYLQANPHLDGDWRIDVIAILHPKSDPEPNIRHFKNAIF